METELAEIASAFVISRAVHTALELNIADAFKDQNEVLHVSEIAKKLQLHEVALYKLMRLLASKNIFHEVAPGRFKTTQLSLLLKDNLSFYCDEPRWSPLSEMSYTIRTGRPAFDKMYGKNYFEFLNDHPQHAALFDRHMKEVTEKEDCQLANALDFSRYGSLMDIGCGLGGLLKNIIARYPDVQATAYDLPLVVKKIENPPFKIKEGSFFDPLPKNVADTLMMKRVLHDWDDEHAKKILLNCRDALADNGKILVIEIIMDHRTDPLLTKTWDLYLMTLFGGRERFAEEYETLFMDCGFSLTQTICTNTGLSILEGTKRPS